MCVARLRRLRAPGLREGLPGQRHDPADVVAGGEFGHHPAVEGVQVDLGVQRLAQHAALAVVEGDAGLVAGGFDAESEHAGAGREMRLFKDAKL